MWITGNTFAPATTKRARITPDAPHLVPDFDRDQSAHSISTCTRSVPLR